MKRLRIFIAFASDCINERQIIRKTCQSDKMVKTLCRELDVSLGCFDFHDVSSDAGRPQSLINAAADRWKPDWFIFVFWGRLGSDAGLGMTGMEEEWNRAISLNKQGGGYPRVSLYFNEAEGNPYAVDSVQESAIEKFKSKVFGEYQALATRFKGSRAFSEQFRSDLSARLIELAKGEGALDLEQEFKECSGGLLSWPRTLGNGEEIQRPELQTILERIRTANSSTILILGEPGSGKSALLAALGHVCLSNRFSVLAIKADRLGSGIDSAESLRKELRFRLTPQNAIKRLASKQPVVVLLDQLDAVSELVDRKSDRLNVLLDLIQGLSGYPGVHIVASSRAFECRHDIRLNSLDADHVDLALPSWEVISPILAKAGYAPDLIGNSTRDLLRTPLCLKVFLDLAKPGAVFSTLQSLLEALWAKKVLVGDAAEDRVKLLEFVASKMSKDEVLWVPSSLGDRWPKALQGLVQEDILSKGPDELTIGFRHQTYYDYTLTRAFAKGALSLTHYVKERQDGLFVRPVLLNGLQYLQDTDLSEYHRQLKALLGNSIRPHIRSLLIEFLGGQKEPGEEEFSLIVSRLRSAKEGPRILAAIAGSPGWFRRMSTASAFQVWMRKPHNEAIHVLDALCQASQFDLGGVLNLLERHWLPRKSHDDLSLRVLSYISDWTTRAVGLASIVLRRTADRSASLLVDQATKTFPEHATMLLRAALDGRLLQAEAIVDKRKKKRCLSPEEKLVQGSSLNGEKGSLVNLIEKEEDWYSAEALAEEAPKSFLDQIWPWFIKVIALIAHDEHPFVLGYRDDPAIYNEFDGELPHGPIVKALLVAVTRLAKQNPDQFIDFVRAHWNSDLLTVHRLLSRGLVFLASDRPMVVLEYLLGDPRRLEVGDYADSHRESKALISQLSARLSEAELKPLEEAVVNFKQYKKTMPDWTVKDRRDRKIWTREHRLRLLRAFRPGSASESLRALREQEERALPGVNELTVRRGGWYVGGRLTAVEMRKASNKHLLNLFNELPDKTGSHNPKMKWSLDSGRAGGAWQLAREFGALAKDAPDRVLTLLGELKPSLHDSYVAEALKGLADSKIPTSTLMACIASLDEKGFVSDEFREGVADSLKMIATKDNGLSHSMLEMLQCWLDSHEEPDANEYKKPRRDEDVKEGRGILFSHSATWAVPNGRRALLEAIAEGYLQQKPPNYSGWASLIESRVRREKHPAIWVLTMARMPPLFNLENERATALFDSVITNCPDVLDFEFALYSIAHILQRCKPRSTVQKWLHMLRLRKSCFSDQAYGELLFLYHCGHNDSWSRARFVKLLRAKRPKRTLLGLAHGASHLWKHSDCRVHANKVLSSLVSSRDPLIVRAVANLFRLLRDEVQLDQPMRLLITRLTKNRRAILQSAEDVLDILTPVTAQEPQLLAQISDALLRFGGNEIKQYAWSTVPENLTSVALTLHRQKKFRAAGLKLFEALIEMNLSQAKSALDVLDRNPVVRAAPYRPTRLRRRRAVIRK